MAWPWTILHCDPRPISKGQGSSDLTVDRRGSQSGPVESQPLSVCHLVTARGAHSKVGRASPASVQRHAAQWSPQPWTLDPAE